MNDLVKIAERLREVKRAQEEFGARAWVERHIIGPLFLDRVAADVVNAGAGRQYGMRSKLQPPAPSDDDN